MEWHANTRGLWKLYQILVVMEEKKIVDESMPPELWGIHQTAEARGASTRTKS